MWEGDPLALILSANNERRHLSTGQRAMATALTLAADGKRANGRWKRGAVPAASTESRNTWQDAMMRAGLILDHAPDLASQVTAGDLALSAAYEQADAERRRAEHIASLGGDLAALVTSGVITVAEAERRADEAIRELRELGMTQQEIADRTGIARQTVSDVERGKSIAGTGNRRGEASEPGPRSKAAPPPPPRRPAPMPRVTPSERARLVDAATYAARMTSSGRPDGSWRTGSISTRQPRSSQWPISPVSATRR